MNKYGYCRVSTLEQHEDRQLVTMAKYGIPEENIYLEKISGRNINRPELQKLLSILKEGDTLIVHDFSRLSRSTADLLSIVDDLNKKGVTLISNKENLDTSTATGKLMLTMIAAINEFELANTKERQMEGIIAAQKRGAFEKKHIDKDYFEELQKEVYIHKTMTVVEACDKLNITKRTWYDKINGRKKRA